MKNKNQFNFYSCIIPGVFVDLPLISSFLCCYSFYFWNETEQKSCRLY